VTEETNRPSYKLVEMPTETSYIPNAEEVAKAVRPVAAVKGITPAAPAPIVAEKEAEIIGTPKLSLFGKIKRFFGGTPALIETPKSEAEKADETRRENNRNNRNRNNRNRNERNRGDRPDKDVNQQNRPNRNNENSRPAETKAQEPRQQKPSQVKNEQARVDQSRNDKPRNNNQQVSAATEAITSNTPTTNLSTEQTSERPGSRRNRNNRRGRRDREDTVARDSNRPFVPNEEIGDTQSNANAAAVIAQESESTVQAKPVVQEVGVSGENVTNIAETKTSEKPKAKSNNRKPKAAKATAVKTEIETTNEIAVEVIPDAAPAKIDNKRPSRPRKPKTEAKPVDLAAVGLQLVETKADAPKAIVQEESTKPKAPRKAASWQKNVKEESSVEPLVMVETQNK
jgi:ribonuclease E